jgi:hypothetical protein
VSVPHLKGSSKTISVGSVCRIPATDIETVIVKSVNGYFCAQHQQPGSSTAHADNPGAMIAEQVIRIDVPKDRRTFDSNPQAPKKHLIRQISFLRMQPMQPAGRLSESPAPGYRHSEK